MSQSRQSGASVRGANRLLVQQVIGPVPRESLSAVIASTPRSATARIGCTLSLMFTQGQIYKRREIHDRFGGNFQSGIASSSKKPLVFIFTTETGKQFGYEDGWHAGIYFYTGEGQVGDMQFKKGNKSIRDHLDNGKDIHLFESSSTAHYSYVGQFVCTGAHDRRGPDRGETSAE
jgi:hypothetical protein